MKLQVKNIIKETDNAVSVSFKNGSLFKKLSYKPGQFLTINVPISGKVHKRAYSFSSSPFEDKDLKITVKRVEKGLVSNYVNDELEIGDKIEVDRPTGSFFVEPNESAAKQYIFFAGGSGITPIYSIIKSVLTKEPKSRILLVYANQNYSSIIFLKDLEKLVEQYGAVFSIEHILSSNDRSEGNFHSGLATEALITKLFKKHGLEFSNDSVYMICGPLGYMEVVKEVLRFKEIKSSQIKVEVFSSPKVKLTGKNLISDVEIQYNGETHKIKVAGNESILKVAMRNNIVLPYACRAGMCVSCKASCVSGEVKMIEGHFLEQEEVDMGNILTCVSYPTTENVVIAY
ncbi:MAG: ferredoxin--NADP reductase [Bacteroidota bacterium]